MAQRSDLTVAPVIGCAAPARAWPRLTPTTWGTLAFFTAYALICAVGCAAQTPGQRAESTFAQFRREHTKEQLFERGKMFAEVGDHTRAEQYFAASIEAGANEHTVFPMLLAACLNDGRFRLAAQYTEDFLKRNPEDVRVRLVLGTIYVAIGDVAHAETELRRVIEQQPSDAQAHYALGTLLKDARPERVEAELHFREYLRLAPNGTYAPRVRETLQQGER